MIKWLIGKILQSYIDSMQNYLVQEMEMMINDTFIDHYKKERDYLLDYIWKKIEPGMNEIREHFKQELWAQLENVRAEMDDLLPKHKNNV